MIRAEWSMKWNVPLNEVPAKISGRLSDNLQSNVVPRHTSDLVTVVHFLLWLVERVEVQNTGIAVVLA